MKYVISMQNPEFIGFEKLISLQNW